MCGNCHYSTGTVACKNVVGNEDRDLLAGCGVDSLNALDLNAGLFLNKLGSLKIGLLGSCKLICLKLGKVGDDRAPLLYHLVLGCDYHIGCTEESVASCGIYSELIACGGSEVNLSAVGLTDPVDLLSLNSLYVVKTVKI